MFPLNSTHQSLNCYKTLHQKEALHSLTFLCIMCSHIYTLLHWLQVHNLLRCRPEIQSISSSLPKGLVNSSLALNSSNFTKYSVVESTLKIWSVQMPFKFFFLLLQECHCSKNIYFPSLLLMHPFIYGIIKGSKSVQVSTNKIQNQKQIYCQVGFHWRGICFGIWCRRDTQET